MGPQSTRVFPRALPVENGGAWKPFMSRAAWIKEYWTPMKERAAKRPCAPHDDDEDEDDAVKSARAASTDGFARIKAVS